MCLLLIAWDHHPDYRLVLAGNRDEFHDRPAAPAGWWKDHPRILAGRDLQAGGSWLGVTRGGRFAVVTNYREPPDPDGHPRSRGALVTDYLVAGAPPARWRPAGDATDYGGYNLVIGDTAAAAYLCNRGEDKAPLSAGLHGLSNHRLDTPWPKVRRGIEAFRQALDRPAVDAAALFAILADREPAADQDLPDTAVPLAWERLLSAAFIVSPRYGTRSSTVLTLARDGGVFFMERRFDAAGEMVGEDSWEFAIEEGGDGAR